MLTHLATHKPRSPDRRQYDTHQQVAQSHRIADLRTRSVGCLALCCCSDEATAVGPRAVLARIGTASPWTSHGSWRVWQGRVHCAVCTTIAQGDRSRLASDRARTGSTKSQHRHNDPVYMSQKLRIFISIFLLSSLNTLILLT